MRPPFPNLPSKAEEWLLPFEPTAEHPFDERAAAHLLRRAGFGGTIEELRELASLGPIAAARRIVNAPDDPAMAELDTTFEAVEPAEKIENLRSWWLLRMTRTKAPFREKLALFFHGHFATAHRKVQSVRAMRRQADLFLKLGSGDFRKLTLEVIRGAAMLIFLDGARSEKGRPNENLARELMELFTLGRGNYSELDIREAARALTGWRVDGARSHFHAPAFDAGEKVVFTKRGAFTDEDIVNLCVAHPACAPFLAKKLLVFFAMPDPPEELVAAFARKIVDNHFSMGPALECLMMSRAFYSAQAYRSNIKSPVEYTIGTLRSLGGRFGGDAVSRAVSEMGQNLMDPPSVKGWDGGRAWIHTATWIARANFAFAAAGSGGPLDREFKAEDYLSEDDTNKMLGVAVEKLLQNDLSPEVRSAMLAQLQMISAGERPRAVLQAVLCLPEYQCC